MKNGIEIALTNIEKSYGDNCVIDGFSANISESTALMGASGKGKTTLARIIAGIESADSGEVKTSRRVRISFVFQEDRLFEDFCAVDNVSAAVKHVSGTQAKKRAAELLEALLIPPSEHKKAVGDFSGGMKRRVAIARALASEYDVLILDEPYKGLDVQTRAVCADVIRKYTEDKLVILITHDEEEASLTGIGNVISI